MSCLTGLSNNFLSLFLSFSFFFPLYYLPLDACLHLPLAGSSIRSSMKRHQHYHGHTHTCIIARTNGGASKTTRTVMTRSSVSTEIDWEPTKFEFFFVPPYFSPSVALRELIDGFVSHIFSQTSFDEIALGEGHSTILSRGCGDFGTMISQ